MSHESMPQINVPGVLPPALQWKHILSDEDELIREELTPADQLAYDYVYWVDCMINEGGEGNNNAMYHYVGEPSILMPSEIKFDYKIELDDRKPGSFVARYRTELKALGQLGLISLDVESETLPPLDPSDCEDVISFYELSFRFGGKSISTIRSDVEVEPSVVDAFRNTFEGLREISEIDYELQE